jgi:hydroxyacylglutathione hydrolase
VQIISGPMKEKIPGASLSMQDLQTMTIGDITIACLTTPGHLKEHVAYVVTHVTPTSTKIPFLFCGDTLFIGGCG